MSGPVHFLALYGAPGEHEACLEPSKCSCGCPECARVRAGLPRPRPALPYDARGDAAAVRAALPALVYGTVGHDIHAALDRLVASARGR